MLANRAKLTSAALASRPRYRLNSSLTGGWTKDWSVRASRVRLVRATLLASAVNVRGSTGVLNVTVTSVSTPSVTGVSGVTLTTYGPDRAVERVNTPRPCVA